MKIHEYNEMMAYLTRPGKAQGGVIGKGGMFQGEDLGYRTGFKKVISADVYNTIYNEYVDLVETGLKNNKLIDTPTWESFVKSKGHSSPSLMYYADKPAPTKLLREKKLELAKKLIDAENLKLDGKWKMHKDGASSIFQGKIFNNRIGQNPGTIEGDVGRLVNKYLDSKDDKIKRAFNYIMNPEYKMSTKGYTGVAHEIQKLIAPNTEKGRITKDIRKILQTIPEYEAVEDKLKYINRILTKVPEGTDTSMGYLMEMAENNKVGRANFEDWWRLAGNKPEQFAMREVIRNWNAAQGKGDFKLYDLDGKEIKWKGKDTKLNTNKLLFSYADPENLGYKNKLYSFFKPDAKTLANINKAVPNKGVFDLKGNIRKLGEFNELVEVVDGRNKLFSTEMIDPFTGEKSTYKKVYENIYKRVNTTAYRTKEGYSKIKSMAGQIDHDFGTKKYPFNNLRISTGQQNHLFKTLVDAAKNNKALEPYVRAIESEIYKGGSIDDQIKAIVKETDELGKVVKNAPGRITIPTATETAALKFLKNKIPDLPESVIKYLEPKSEKALKTIRNLLNSADKNQIMRIRKLFGCPDLKSSGGRVGLQGGGNLLDCPMKKFAENPEAALNKVGQAMPETRTPIMNAFKKLGMGTLKWGGRAFIGLTPIFAGMEIADASRKYEEGIPSGQIAMDAFGNWVVPGAGGMYKTYQDRKMMKDIASPQELAAMEKEDDRRYYNMLQKDPLREADYSKKLEETQTTLKEQLELFKLMEKQKATEYWNQQRRKGERAKLAEESTDTFSNLEDWSAAEGGRVGFDEGSKPKSPSRRAFIKGITALAALPIVGKYFKLGKVLERAQPYYGPTVEKIKGMPEWFPGLVKKLWNEGEDVTKQVAYGERQIVKRGTLEGGDDVDMIVHMDTGDVSINVTPKKGKYETSSGAYNKEYSLNYKKGIGDESTRGTPPDDFVVGEVRPSNVDPDGNVDWNPDYVDVDEAMSNLQELENFTKKKK